MTPSAPSTGSEAGEHIVKFYERDAELAATVAGFLGEALQAGGTAVAIATPEHRAAFAAALRGAGLDTHAAAEDGTLVLLDAADTLRRLCPGGELSPAAFREQVGGLVGRAGARGQPVHAYGEMVALLWDDGHVLAALELEELWSRLGQEMAFSLLCGYRESSVAGAERADSLERVCRLHSSVCGATPDAGLRPLERSVELGPEPETPAAARRLLAEALAEAGQADPVLAQEASLLLSELVTNAVVHARSSVGVAVRCDRSGVRLSVSDRNPGPISVSERGPHSGLGVGLQIVGLLSSDWGVDPAPEGKTVWATLRTAARPAPRTCLPAAAKPASGR